MRKMEEIKRLRIKSVFDILAPHFDYTLIAGLNREKILIVRKCLMEKSGYFEKLLGPTFREGAREPITLKYIDGPTLMAILTFIYTGYVDITEDCVEKILDGASRMELTTLEKLCEDFLRENLSKSNCVRTISIAEKHGFQALRASALECVTVNLERIPKTEVLQLNDYALSKILECDKVSMEETSLFNLLVEWAEQNKFLHSPFMPNLLKSIRFENLPGEFIMSVAKPICELCDSGELISAEYDRRMLNYQSFPRRWHEKDVKKSIFYAKIVDNKSIDIHKCYPNHEDLPTIQLPVSRKDEGWAFHDGRLYRMGGYHFANGGHTSDEVECIHIYTKECTKLPNMLNARSAFKPLVCGKYIYVFGGKNQKGFIYDCERFDTQTKQWKALPAMRTNYRNCVTIEMNGKIILVGEVVYPSCRKKYICWCEYDPNTEEWSGGKSKFEKDGNVTLVKNGNHIFNIIENSASIRIFDTQNDWALGKRKISLPGIVAWKIVECAGSPYIFYTSFGKHKFGRVVTNRHECVIVDSVELSKPTPTAFLFMH